MIESLLVDENDKVIFCDIPKVSCTNFKALLAMSSVNMNLTCVKALNSMLNSDQINNPLEVVHSAEFMQAAKLKWMTEYSLEDAKYKLDHYYKFVFVRNPFDRLVSAWYNKLIEGKDYFHTYLKLIKSQYSNMSDVRNVDFKDLDPVTFEEFVKYLVDIAQKKQVFNWHWKSFAATCYPCDIHYDLIGKLETLNEDIKPLLENLAIDDEHISFPSKTNGPTFKGSRNKSSYLSSLSQSLYKNLVKLYVDDFEMFGYDPNVL